MPGRHKNIGMNRPKKITVDVVELLKVKVLLRGSAQELAPEPEPEPKVSHSTSAVVLPEPKQLAIAKRKLEACRRARTRIKEVLKISTKAAKGLRARRNAHGSKPPQLGLSAWQKERVRLVLECDEMQEVKEEAERDLQFAELDVVIWERAVEKIRATLLGCFLSAHGVHVPAWLR
jgi:hypothetical protein